MIGVIPAGGKAERFMGVHKDMLPIGDGEFLFTAALSRARSMGCERCVVVTSAEKAAMHERLIGSDDTLMVSTGKGLWEAIRATFCFREDSLLVLADTVFTPHAMPRGCPLFFGVFPTDQPERFSVLRGDTIVTKQAGAAGHAWGCVAWSVEVAQFWAGTSYPHYDDAFRDAMQTFGSTTFPITDYHDLGDWNAYQRYITEHASF